MLWLRPLKFAVTLLALVSLAGGNLSHAAHQPCLEPILSALSEESVISEGPGWVEQQQLHVHGLVLTSKGYRLTYSPHPVRTGAKAALPNYQPDPNHPALDFLFNSGPASHKLQSRFEMQTPLKRFEYTPPRYMIALLSIEELAQANPQHFTLKPLTGSPEQRLWEYLSSLGQNMDAQITPIGKGGYSTAYAVHPEVPTGTPDRPSWALKHAVAIAKVRHALREGMDPRSIALVFLRDLAVGRLAKQLLERVKFRGKQLIRVADIKGGAGAAERGIMLQAPAQGISTQDLALAVDKFLTAEGAPPADAIDTLKKAGFTGPFGAVSRAKAKEALQYIQALEHSYRLVNNDALNYEYENGLVLLGNTMHTEDRKLSLVGLDYNHGRNVIWDPKTRMFVVIDW
ncbi:hypothetical protein WDW37_01385 [Bdellovibrionota bacterium FG-1]